MFKKFYEADKLDDIINIFNDIKIKYFNDNKDEYSFNILYEKIKDDLSFKESKIFTQIANNIKIKSERKHNITNNNINDKVLVTGGGPIGLITAIELKLTNINRNVTVVEKRSKFSRHNILVYWEYTMKYYITFILGKLWNPTLKTHGDLIHCGTREVQLAALKTGLLLGVNVLHQSKILTFIKNKINNNFDAIIELYNNNNNNKTDALSLKNIEKEDNYQQTFRCNMVTNPEIDQEFIGNNKLNKDDLLENDKKVVNFDALFIAEGEWSTTAEKLGFNKTIDKFKQAFGMVINAKYNQKNKEEKLLKEYNSSAMDFNDTNLTISLTKKDIYVERIEYLKGSTHFVVASVMKKTLLSRKIFKEDLKSSKELLSKDNVDFNELNKLANIFKTSIGLAEDVELCDENPIQLFDFSSRSRALHPFKFLTFNDNSKINLINGIDYLSLDDNDKKLNHYIPAFVVGDSLLEPFWTQSLGINRGIHNMKDAIYTYNLMKLDLIEDSIDEIYFFNRVITSMAWRKQIQVLNNANQWTNDGKSRYTHNSIKLIKEEYRTKQKKSKVPKRLL